MTKEISKELGIGAGIAGLVSSAFGWREIQKAMKGHSGSIYSEISKTCGVSLNPRQLDRLQDTNAWKTARPLPRTLFESIANTRKVALDVAFVLAGFQATLLGATVLIGRKNDAFSKYAATALVVGGRS